MKNVCDQKKKPRKRTKRRRIKRRIKQKNLTAQQYLAFHFPSIMSGDFFWKNYTNVLNWERNYANNFRTCSPYVLNNSKPNYSLMQSYNNAVPFYESTTISSNDSNINNSTTDNSTEENIKSEHCSDSELDVASEDDYEVTNEMMEFLEISMKHKEALKLKKKEEEKADRAIMKESDNEIHERDNIEECQAPKERAIDAKRIEEMSELYGKASPMILGMETALQLTFNRNCDRVRPSYWPYLALNLQFTE